MQYIVFDLEFNQDFSSVQPNAKVPPYPFEIIQIGAIKLDSSYNTIGTFNRFIKPTIYSQISSFVADLTGITTNQLSLEETFPIVFDSFIEFIGDDNTTVFCIWGMSDIKELFRNVEYHMLDKKLLPVMFINLQPYVSRHFNLPQSKLLNLQVAVENLSILMPFKFHDALYDAYYTVEIFKKITINAISPNKYDTCYIKPRSRQPKKTIDFEKLQLQFEKMYSRKLSSDEQEMIKLAYKMGKTNQFLK